MRVHRLECFCSICDKDLKLNEMIRVTSYGKSPDTPHSGPVETTICWHCWQKITDRFIGRGDSDNGGEA